MNDDRLRPHYVDLPADLVSCIFNATHPTLRHAPTSAHPAPTSTPAPHQIHDPAHILSPHSTWDFQQNCPSLSSMLQLHLRENLTGYLSFPSASPPLLLSSSPPLRDAHSPHLSHLDTIYLSIFSLSNSRPGFFFFLSFRSQSIPAPLL